MLKIYDSLDQVPEALRPEYKLSGTKYVPDLSEDHPLVVNSAKLLTEKATAEANMVNAQTKISGLEADLVSARSATGLPRGHRAVPVADAELLEQIKPHGTPTEVIAKLGEHKTLKEESNKRGREEHLRKVAKALGYDNADAFVLLADLPEFEIRTKDGNETVIAKVKDGANIVEKPQDSIDSLPSVAPFLSALKTKPGTYAPEQRRENQPVTGDVFDKTRKSVQAAEKAAIPPSAVDQRFGIAATQ